MDGGVYADEKRSSKSVMRSTQDSNHKSIKSQLDFGKYENYKQSHINGYCDFQPENKQVKLDKIKQIVSKAKMSKRNYQAELF